MFSIIAASCSLQSLSSHLSRNEMINSISLTMRQIIWRGRDHYRLFWPRPDVDKRWLISVCRINHVLTSLGVNGFTRFISSLISGLMHSRWCRGLWWWPQGQMSVSPSPDVSPLSAQTSWRRDHPSPRGVWWPINSIRPRSYNWSVPPLIITSGAQLDHLQLQPKHIVIHLPLCQDIVSLTVVTPGAHAEDQTRNIKTRKLIPRKYKNVRKIGVNASKLP